MPVWVEGDPSRENPPPALPLNDSPAQILRFEILGRFSLLWLSKAFSSCFPGRKLPIGLEAETLQLWIPQHHSLRDKGHLKLRCSTSRDLVPLDSTPTLLIMQTLGCTHSIALRLVSALTISFSISPSRFGVLRDSRAGSHKGLMGNH